MSKEDNKEDNGAIKRTCRNCKKYASFGHTAWGSCFHAHTDDTICENGWEPNRKR